MKRPRTLFLPPTLHHEVANRVRLALADHGTLHGYFEFIERAGQHLAQRSTSTDAIRPDSSSALGVELAPLDDLTVSDIFAPRTGYVPKWNEAKRNIGWFEEDPAAAHVLGLFRLLDAPAAWRPIGTWRTRRKERGANPRGAATQTGANVESDASTTAGLFTAVKAFAAAYGDRAPAAPRTGKPSFRPRSVDIVWNVDTPETVSLSLDPDLHDHFKKVFGNEFYLRTENALLLAFDDPAYEVEIAPICRALEAGKAPDTSPNRVRAKIAEAMDELDPGGPADERTVLGEPSTAEEQERIFARPIDGNREAWLDRLLEKLVYEEDSSWIDDPFWQFVQEVLDGYEEVEFLHIARSIGIVKTVADLESLGDDFNLFQAMRSHFDLEDAAPTRANALRILSRADLPDDLDGDVPTAVDHHLLELFRLYAKEVRDHPSEPLGHRAAWTTLSKPELFPLSATLEAWTGGDAERRPDGTWTVRRGRQEPVVISSEQAVALHRFLDRLAPVRSGPLITRWMWSPLTALPPQLRTGDTVRISTSTDLLHDVLHILESSEDHLDAAEAFLREIVGIEDTPALQDYMADWRSGAIFDQLDEDLEDD